MTHADLEPLRAACLDAVAGTRHGFFTRAGGDSAGIYASLNCGPGSGDTPAAVAANRARVATLLGTDATRLLSPWQVHGADAIEVTAPWSGERPKADALATRVPGLAIGVLTADCAPVLFADSNAGVVGAAHAGWRGALGGVLEAAIVLMERLGARRSAITAVVGPAIGPAAYEVGEEFESTFRRVTPDNAQFFTRGVAGKPHFDLPAYATHRLEGIGVGRVDSLRRCTYSDAARFYSFRRATHRGEADYGRQISAIVLE